MTLKLNKKFYTKEAVKKTLEAFKETRYLEMKETEEYYIISAGTEENSDEERTLKEFANYCLAESK